MAKILDKTDADKIRAELATVTRDPTSTLITDQTLALARAVALLVRAIER